MPLLELHFDGVYKEPIPEGQYLFILTSVQVKQNKAKDGNNLILNAKVIEPEEFYDEEVSDLISLKPQVRWRLQAMLEAVTGNEWREDGMSLDTDELIGEKFLGVIVHQPNYQDDTKMDAKIKTYLHYDPAFEQAVLAFGPVPGGTNSEEPF